MSPVLVYFRVTSFLSCHGAGNIEHKGDKIDDQRWHHRLLETEHSASQGMVGTSSPCKSLPPSIDYEACAEAVGHGQVRLIPKIVLKGDVDAARGIIVCHATQTLLNSHEWLGCLRRQTSELIRLIRLILHSHSVRPAIHEWNRFDSCSLNLSD